MSEVVAVKPQEESMRVIDRIDDLCDVGVYVNLERAIGLGLLLKCEGLNLAGSIKLRTAVSLIDAAAESVGFGPESTLIESSSGNLGIAIAAVAASRGLKFVCVVDPNCNAISVKIMKSFGARIESVTEAGQGGFLEQRKRRVVELCNQNPQYMWLNQYENEANWRAHYEITAPQVANDVADLDVLFVGAGTGGTLVGCLNYFRQYRPSVQVIAIDTQGSVSFNSEAGPRHIPGLGASVPMPILEGVRPDGLVRVPEDAAIAMCRALAGRGLLFGGSTGTVIEGARRWLTANDPAHRLVAVALSPDLGERYLDTIYDETWTFEKFGIQTQEGVFEHA